MIPTIIHHYGTEGVQGHIGGDVEDNNNHNYNYTNTNPDIGFLSLSSYSSYAGKVATMAILVVSGVGLVGGLVFLLCYFTNSANNIVVMGGVALLSCILIVICYTKPISMLTSFEDDEVKDDEPPAYEDVMMEPPPPSYFTVVNENPYTNNTPTGTTTTTTTTTTTLPSQYQLHVAPKDAPLFSKLLMKMGGLMGQTVCRSGRIYYGSDSSVPSSTAAGGVAGVGESVVRRSGVSMVCTRPVIREGHVVHSHGSGGLCGGGSGWPSRALQQVSARINPTLSRISHPTSPPPPPPGQGGEDKVVKNTHILPHELLVQSSTTSLSTRLRKSPSTPILTSPSSDVSKRQSVTSVVSRSRVSCPFFLGTSSTTAALSKRCCSSSTDDSYSSTNLKSSCYPSTKELTTSFPDYYSSSFSTSFPDYYSSSSTSFPDYSSYSTASFPDYSLSFPDYSTSTTSFRRSSSTPYLNSCTDAFSSSCHTSTSPTTPAKPTPYTSSSSSLSSTSFLRRSSSTPFVSTLLVPSFPSSGTLASSKSSSDVNNTSKPAASTTTSSCSSTPTSLPSFHRSSSFPYLTSLSTSNNTSTSSSVYNPPSHRISYSTPSSPITGTRLVHHQHHHHHSNTLSPNIRPRRQRVSIESPPPASVIVEVDSEGEVEGEKAGSWYPMYF